MPVCGPTEGLGHMAPPTACHLPSLGQLHTLKVQRKASGAFSGHGETQSMLGGGHSYNMTSFAIFLLSRIKIPFIKESFPESIFRNQPLQPLLFLYSWASLLSAIICWSVRKSWSVLCRIKKVGKESRSHRQHPIGRRGPGQADPVVTGKSLLLIGRGRGGS